MGKIQKLDPNTGETYFDLDIEDGKIYFCKVTLRNNGRSALSTIEERFEVLDENGQSIGYAVGYNKVQIVPSGGSMTYTMPIYKRKGRRNFKIRVAVSNYTQVNAEAELEITSIVKILEDTEIIARYDSEEVDDYYNRVKDRISKYTEYYQLGEISIEFYHVSEEHKPIKIYLHTIKDRYLVYEGYIEEYTKIDIPSWLDKTYDSIELSIFPPKGVSGVLQMIVKKKPEEEKPPEVTPPEPQKPENPFDVVGWLEWAMRNILRDEEAPTCTPYYTRFLVLLLATIYTATLSQIDQWVQLLGLVPIVQTLLGQWYRMITYMWIHYPITQVFDQWTIPHAHIAFNVLFLYVFGDNVECRVGAVRYFAYYILIGLLSGLGQVAWLHLIGLGSTLIYIVGASGAISGILGMYLVFFPSNNLIFLGNRVKAFWFIGFWFLGQISILFQMNVEIAVAGHITGFVIGVILGLVQKNLEKVKLPIE